MDHQSSFFHDSIHGHIELSELERVVVDHVEFQRLRFIRQLSLLHYVFPGAFHTRFAHSIGSCHNAKLVSDKFFPNIKNEDSKYVTTVFRLACLLHDLGHGAFSHTLSYLKHKDKSFLPTFNEVIAAKEAWGLEGCSEKFLKMLKAASKGIEDHAIEHEVLSAIIINRIFSNIDKDILPKIEKKTVEAETIVEDISSLILHSNQGSETFLTSARSITGEISDKIIRETSDSNSSINPETLEPIISSLVSGMIDCDRMDYLLRDSMNCGVNYGLFDRDGIISAMNIVSINGDLRLGINSKRVNTVDDFLWSRYQMFRQVYCHKTSNAYNKLLELALGDLIENQKVKSPKNIEDYLCLTDDYIMSEVFSTVVKKNHSLWWIEAFASRKLPEFLGLYEQSAEDPIWQSDNYAKKSFDELGELGNIDIKDVIWTSMKVEVIPKNDSASNRLPVVINKNKKTGQISFDNFLGKSVFFKSDLPIEDRLSELRKRLNKKIIFFFHFV